jgi:hypothetical protein
MQARWIHIGKKTFSKNRIFEKLQFVIKSMLFLRLLYPFLFIYLINYYVLLITISIIWYMMYSRENKQYFIHDDDYGNTTTTNYD